MVKCGIILKISKNLMGQSKFRLTSYLKMYMYMYMYMLLLIIR